MTQSKKIITDARTDRDLNEGQDPQGKKITLGMTEEVKCDKCGHILFNREYTMRRIPALITGTGRPMYTPIPVFRCGKCGHINEELDALKNMQGQ